MALRVATRENYMIRFRYSFSASFILRRKNLGGRGLRFRQFFTFNVHYRIAPISGFIYAFRLAICGTQGSEDIIAID